MLGWVADWQFFSQALQTPLRRGPEYIKARPAACSCVNIVVLTTSTATNSHNQGKTNG